jgi:LysM repeat protein
MRRRRSPARWLAPIALVACAVAVYTVVNATLLSSDEPASKAAVSKSSTTSKSRTVSERSKTSKRRSTRRRRTYTVKSGDTLSSIAVKTGVSLERIQALNPKLDSQSLQTGQRVKLSP